ncbi:MAG: hypothetical protein ACU83O_10630 [Gammaproteobacteria bacterium]
MFTAKDFIETDEGLLFAVVDSRLEDGKALCFLRYKKEETSWKKQATFDANKLLNRHHPHYLHYSSRLDTTLHAVEVGRIVKHYRPKQRLQDIMRKEKRDPVERDFFEICRLFEEQGLDMSRIGVTGSLLIAAQKDASDIDLVCYGREVFHQCRAATRDLIESGRLQNLSDSEWQESYRRRNCSLSYDDYVWHERRKFNKALINGRKFDLAMIECCADSQPETHRKCGKMTLHCRIIDDLHSFDFPAIYKVDHPKVDAIVCFTATYSGQAFKGETVEVAGMLEQTAKGRQIVVGSSREAPGEYLKVINA